MPAHPPAPTRTRACASPYAQEQPACWRGVTKVSSAANGQNSTHLAAALHCVSVVFLPNTPYMPRHGRRQNTNGTRSLQCAPPPPHKGCHRISPSPPLSQNGAPHPFFLLQCEVEIPLMSSRLWLRPTTRRSLQSKLPGFFPTKMAGLALNFCGTRAIRALTNGLSVVRRRNFVTVACRRFEPENATFFPLDSA